MTDPCPDRVAVSLDEPPRIRFLGNGQFGPRSLATYRLTNRWALHVYQYEAEWRLDEGPWHALRPGMVGLTPPGATAHYRWSREGCLHACAHFELSPSTTATHRVPLLSVAFGWVPAAFDLLQTAIGCYPIHPRRAEAILWHLLWQLVDEAPSAATPAGPHPAVQRAVAYIERHLADPLTVADIVAQSDVSHNHLTRLFQKTYRTSVIAYLRQRRAKRARQLLQETDRPAKAIAIEVGIPDLQQFNKLMRQSYGAPPRRLRRVASGIVSRPRKR